MTIEETQTGAQNRAKSAYESAVEAREQKEQPGKIIALGIESGLYSIGSSKQYFDGMYSLMLLLLLQFLLLFTATIITTCLLFFKVSL